MANYRFRAGKGVYSLSMTVRLQGITARVIWETGNYCDRVCSCLMNQGVCGS
jgi:hypothetical protein